MGKARLDSNDANILSLLINENSTVANDFRSGLPVDRAHEKIDALIASLQQSGELTLIPAPALAEALVPLAPNVNDHVNFFEQSSNFRIAGFGTRAAVEHALRLADAMKKGNKRDFVDAPWTKVNFDRQIVAIALVEGATSIYSTDKDIHNHASIWGIPVSHLGDIPLPQKTRTLFDDLEADTEQDGRNDL